MECREHFLPQTFLMSRLAAGPSGHGLIILVHEQNPLHKFIDIMLPAYCKCVRVS